METIKPLSVSNQSVMTPIAKPTIKNTKFRPVAKPVIQEKPNFGTIEKVKPANIDKPKPTLKIEEYLPLVALGVIAIFIVSRNN